MEKEHVSETLQKFAEAAGGLANPALMEWRKQGGKVLGHFCCHFPIEIVSAAGLLPFRMRATGSKDTSLADDHVSAVNCTFVRHCLDVALSGGYDALIDGMIWISTCTHISRLYDIWTRKAKLPVLHFFSTGRKINDAQVAYQLDQMEILKEKLEKTFDVRISNERLSDAIKGHNEKRRLQKNLYELRKSKTPPITGADALAVTVAATAMPLEIYNQLLRQLLDELKHVKTNGDYRARVMLVGALLDDPSYIEIIEEQGGLVVADSLCFGSRTFWSLVEENTDDPLGALAQYYAMDRPSCPRVFGDHARRADYVKDMVRRFDVDGVIMESISFCDPWGGEIYSLKQDLRDEGIPFLTLEREYLLSGVGQLKTRVQAFMETIGR